MSLLQANLAGLGGSGAPGGALAGGAVYSYPIDQSLRFNDGDDPYLTFTPSSATNQKTWTYSLWVKRTNFAARQCLLAAGTGGGLVMEFRFGLSDQLEYLDSSSTYLFITSQKFRDPAAWYHIVLRVDTTESNANERTRLYVNGEQITSFSTDNRSNHTLNEDLAVNTTTVHYISRWVTGGENHDGYLAEINFLDGVSVDCNSFGEFKDGVWVPKEYSGSYGTNGWRLDFADSSDIGNNANTTDGTNDWTPNNLAAADVVPDSPTNNFACLNPLYHSSSQAVLSEGNLKADPAGFVNAANGYGAVSTFAIPKDKKIYIEVECTDGASSNWFAGFAAKSGLESGPSSTLVGGSNAITVYNRSVYVNGSETDYGSSAGLGGLGVANLSAGDILGCMCDGATGKVWFSRNGSYFKSPTTDNSGTTGDPAGGNHEIGTITNGTTEDVFFVIGGNTSVSSIFVNFGQDTVNVASAETDANGIGSFEYAPPTDYLALCTSNLPDITIGPGQDTQADDHFETMLYTGNGATQHIGSGGAQHPQDTTTIANSVRFEDGDNNYLTKSDQGTSSSDKQFTFSCWVKRGNKGSYNTILGTPEGGDREYFGFLDTNEFIYQINNGTNLISNRKFLDVSGWYHVVVAVNINESTASDRQKIYINGEQITSFSSANYYGSSDTVQFMKNGAATFIGRLNTTNVNSFDGYMAEINFIDGSTLDPTYFGQVGSNGYWIPKALSGLTYGTNGFRLDFADSSALGDDESGNTNDFTVSGLAATDQVSDSPTQNFATFDPNNLSGSAVTLSEGNLKAERTTSSFGQAYSTYKVTSGKWYAEFLIDTGNSGVGVIAGETIPGTNRYMGQDTYTYGYYTDGRKVNNATYSSYGDSYSTAADGSGDVIGVLIDADNGNISFSKNGTVQNSGTPAFSGVQGPFRFAIASESNCFHIANFGQDDTFAGLKTSGSAAAADGNGYGSFYDTPPTGYLALVDDNIPQEGIASPDFVWIKSRSAATIHNVFDTVRGAGKVLQPQSAEEEQTVSTYLTAFGTEGFTLGDSTNVNASSATFASWNWKAGGPSPTQTYTVTVASDGGQNKYRFDGNSTFAPTLSLQEGGTYTFDQSDSSNSGHPLRFSTTSDGTHNSGSEYTTGVTTSGTPGSSGAKTVITVAHGAPTLYYYCSSHSGMGGQANTTDTHGSTNLKGSIQSVVSANQDAGFSIVSYTGTGVGANTVGHGLTQKPDMVICKARTSAGVHYWHVNHKDLTASDYNIFLQDSGAQTDVNTNYAEGGIGLGDANVIDFVAGYSGANNVANCNNSSSNYIAYCFHSVEGFSRVTSYVGNASTNGTFCHLGHRPAWIMLKNASASGAWYIFDVKRNTFNEMDKYLRPNIANAEGTLDFCDFTSNGFKIRSSAAEWNGSGNTIIVLSFAEQPFKFANAR